MSMPFTKIACTACEASWSSMMLWGTHSYELAKGKELTLERCLGWCDMCGEIRSVESIESLEAGESHLSQLKDQLKEERRKRNRNPLNYLFKKDIKHLKQKVSEHKLRMNWQRSRQSLPRCLTCGNHDIQKLPIPSLPEEPTKIGFMHRGCTGELYCESSDIRINIRPDKKVFNIEGRLIRTEHRV